MSLRIPTTGADLLGLGKKMHAGLILLAELLKITQMTPASFLAFITAFQSSDDNFNAARSADQAVSNTYKAAMAAVDEWLATVKGVLLARFGSGYTTEWVQAGFINNSTKIPATIADRMALTARLVAFFAKNPSYEVPSLKATAAQGTAVEQAALAAQQSLTTSTRSLKDLGAAWDAAFKALSDEEWTLVKLLQATLNDDDTRWLAFGLPMPSAISTPGKPLGLSAHLDETGAIVVQNDAEARATRYRYRMMIVGVDTKYALAATSPIPLATISDVQPGTTVQLIVQAVNGNLQGVASEPITFTMPLVTKPVAVGAEPKSAVSAPLLPEVVVSTNGNGHRNGDRMPALS